MIAKLLNYFKNIRTKQTVLWCYLVWYATIISLYFEASIKLWASSIGISAIIGFALMLSTNQQGANQNIWGKIRLFLFPFCVSSYSATIKDSGFILLFPSNLLHLSISIINCLLFILMIWVIKRMPSRIR